MESTNIGVVSMQAWIPWSTQWNVHLHTNISVRENHLAILALLDWDLETHNNTSSTIMP